MIKFITSTSFHTQHFTQVRWGLKGQKTIHAAPVNHRVVAPAPKKTTQNATLPKAVRYFLNAIIALSLVVVVAIVGPYLYYQVIPADTQPIQALEKGTPLGGSFDQGAQATTNAAPMPLPPQDPNLPAGEWLIIPRIGVRTELQATEDEEEALKTGVWMVPEYGRPGDKNKPVILAAHRYGWQWWWQTDYWKYHSFYNLPELQPGDLIETIVDQRKYTYEVYAGEEGEEISDYYADMILYTCKYLNSPLRHFRYARLVDWTKDTQAGKTSGVTLSAH